jgi:hypothetical protein
MKLTRCSNPLLQPVVLSSVGWAAFLTFSSRLWPTADFIRRSDVCVRSDLDERKVCYLFRVECVPTTLKYVDCISNRLLRKNSELTLFFKHKQAGWSNNSSDWYSGSVHFESCLRHNCSWIRFCVFLLSPFRPMQAQYCAATSVDVLWSPPNAIRFLYNSTPNNCCRWYTVVK